MKGIFGSDAMKKLIIEIHRKGKLTRDEQDIYKSKVGFYLTTTKLRNFGIIESIGRDRRNQKIWTLTDKGEKIIGALKKLIEVFGD